jgi:glycosyltransferase involved in cell wall biosynthesis
MSKIISATVIISTYNAEAWLEKVLWGYASQTTKDFEILIADDGSGPQTKLLINKMINQMPVAVHHVWHEDKGFRKTEILNKAIQAAQADYLIFSDGDCIPRKDFVATHLKYRAVGYFLSGGYFKLPMSISQQINHEDVVNQLCFDLLWLRKNKLSPSIKNLKLSSCKWLVNLLNAITPTKPTWNGHNASAWKCDVVAVNGFDRNMQYGGEDREFGERLVNFGLKARQMRYVAIVVHLDHARGYVNEEMWKKNNAIRAFTKKNKIIQTPKGIVDL